MRDRRGRQQEDGGPPGAALAPPQRSGEQDQQDSEDEGQRRGAVSEGSGQDVVDAPRPRAQPGGDRGEDVEQARQERQEGGQGRHAPVAPREVRRLRRVSAGLVGLPLCPGAGWSKRPSRGRRAGRRGSWCFRRRRTSGCCSCLVVFMLAREPARDCSARIIGGLPSTICRICPAQREDKMRLIASLRVATEVRNWPRTAQVTVATPGLRTPRIDMHRCSACTTTMTPAAIEAPSPARRRSGWSAAPGPAAGGRRRRPAGPAWTAR